MASNLRKYKIVAEIHVHSEPKKESEAIRLLNPGDIIESDENKNGWIKIEDGYVFSGWGKYAVIIKDGE